MPVENLATYSRNDVVTFYQQASGLMPPERHVFANYLRDGMDVLDIGVGGGRTTEYLAPRAGRYLGVDYAPAMVDACRERFPGVAFATGDATNLADIADNSFDFVIFSFNGIDSIPSDAGRIAALREMRRVAKPDGVVVMSSHNARKLALYPQFEGAGPLKALWRIALSLARSPAIAFRSLSSGAWKNGAGYLADPVHGGLYNHASTPPTIARDAAAAGLRIVETVGTFHPRKPPHWCENWYTYVLARDGQ